MALAARRAGYATPELMKECRQLHEDVLRCAHEMKTQESDPEVLEAAGDFCEMAHLLDRLLQCLVHSEFTELDDCLQCLESRMRSAEIRANSWDG